MPKKNKRKTNVQVVRDIMEYSNHGALAQLFVMDAIGKFADQVAKSKVSDYPKNMFICPESWIAVAKEIRGKLDKHFNGGGEG